MAMPAVKREQGGGRVAAPRVRLVDSTFLSAATRCSRKQASRSHAGDVARCRRGFRFACASIVLLAAIAMGRVELTVHATEASIRANTLRAEIESERLKSEALEARRMELAAPQRIESIAGLSMGMNAAGTVAYIDAPDSSEDGADDGYAAEAGPLAGSASDRVASLVASIMRMTAGEAQVLLVGDAGLASSR